MALQNLLKYTIVLPIVVILVACGDNEEVGKKLVVGVAPDYPPFEFIKNGEIVGFDIDLASEIAKSLDKKLEVKEIAFEDLIAALRGGNIEVIISAMTQTKARAENVDFSNLYYRSSDMSLLFKPDKKAIHSSSNLEGLIIGVQSSSFGEKLLNENEENMHFEVLPLIDNNQLIEHLKNGKIDAVLIETMQAKVFKDYNKELEYIKIDSMPIVQLPDNIRGFAIALKKKSDLLPEVNVILEQLAASGKLKALEEKWLEGYMD